MRTEMVIRDVQRTESLEEYLSSHIENIVETMVPQHRNAVLKLKVKEDSHRTNLRRPHFECSVYLKMGRQKPIYITKQASQFHVCVDKLASALREALRRIHQKGAPLHRSNRFHIEEEVVSEYQSA